MTRIKEDDKAAKLTGEQIVKKKLDEVNAMLRKMDPAQLERIRKGKSIHSND
ncbi:MULTISPECIES: hypothetical protein [unclassified Dyadobacter]|uniref:hypothetical protein n=1 Tax=unclassified Dyadobacter TaxID=2625061 RepID=UPI001F37DFCC|nr:MULTISPECIES: hypothetical protein [unclassified Dyadobacter]MCE7069811.1 hypothetical protein [Dyadobacter sp. CY327]MCF2516775.1 hypothetical protein [Dyadobacter sp. CY351]